MAGRHFALLTACCAQNGCNKCKHSDRQKRTSTHAHHVAIGLELPSKPRASVSKIVPTNGQTNRRPALSADNSNTQAGHSRCQGDSRRLSREADQNQLNDARTLTRQKGRPGNWRCEKECPVRQTGFSAVQTHRRLRAENSDKHVARRCDHDQLLCSAFVFLLWLVQWQPVCRRGAARKQQAQPSKTAWHCDEKSMFTCTAVPEARKALANLWLKWARTKPIGTEVATCARA